jgi:hypothetical protein
MNRTAGNAEQAGRAYNGSLEREGAAGAQARTGTDTGRVEIQRLGGNLKGGSTPGFA